MIRINLLPYRAVRKRELIRRQAVVGILPLLITCVVIGFFWWSINTKNVQAQESIQDLQEKIRQSRLQMRDIDNFKAQKETLTKKMDIIESLEKNRTGPVRILDEIATRLPGNVWLVRLDQADNTLKIEGRAMDNISISRYMLQLEDSPFISDVTLDESRTVAVRGGVEQLKSFKLHARVRYTLDEGASS